MFIRSLFNYDRSEASHDASSHNPQDKPSLTIQSQTRESDINYLVSQYGLTGLLAQVNAPPTYQDFDEVFDFQSAMNVIRAAQESFDALPANIRYRFHNDPARFVEFCNDPDNLEEARKIGVALPEPPAIIPPEPQKVVIVNPDALPPSKP